VGHWQSRVIVLYIFSNEIKPILSLIAQEAKMNDENLEKGLDTRFKPGQSGNPRGRPRNRPFSDRIEELAETLLPEKERIELDLPEGSTWADAIVEATYESAIEGKTEAVREIREAVEGRAAPRKERKENAESDLIITLVYERSEKIKALMAKAIALKNSTSSNVTSS
jgi:Family of unknown function (DUF5681)